MKESNGNLKDFWMKKKIMQIIEVKQENQKSTQSGCLTGVDPYQIQMHFGVQEKVK